MKEGDATQEEINIFTIMLYFGIFKNILSAIPKWSREKIRKNSDDVNGTILTFDQINICEILYP